MVKKGDFAFGYSIIVLLVLIFMLLREYPLDRIVFLGEMAFGLLLAFLLVSMLTMPRPKQPLSDYSSEVKAIEKLIQVAEANLDYDIKKSIEAYNRVKVYYSSLKADVKSQVVDDALRVFTLLVEKMREKKK